MGESAVNPDQLGWLLNRTLHAETLRGLPFIGAFLLGQSFLERESADAGGDDFTRLGEFRFEGFICFVAFRIVEPFLVEF